MFYDEFIENTFPCYSKDLLSNRTQCWFLKKFKREKELHDYYVVASKYQV